MKLKLIITLFVAVIVAIYTVGKSAYANTADEQIKNAEALYFSNPDNPEKPEPIPCWTKFYTNSDPTQIPFRVCGSDPVEGGGPSRMGATKCLEIYAYYFPDDSSGNVCYKQADPQ